VIWAGGALLGWIAGSLLPDDPVFARFLSGVSKVDMDTTYNWFGTAGHLKWDFEVEPIAVLFGIAGAIIVVLAGLYLRRNVRIVEVETVVSH
jgi:hypothetical protein